METIGTVIAVIGTIGFIVAMWMLFGYLYFKKGSVKKGFLLLLVSLLLVGGGIVIGIQGAWNNSGQERGQSDSVIPADVMQILDNISVEDATQEQQAAVGRSVYLKINEEDWVKYGDKIREYYIAWQKSLNAQMDEDVLKERFEELRQQALSK